MWLLCMAHVSNLQCSSSWTKCAGMSLACVRPSRGVSVGGLLRQSVQPA